MGGYRLTIQYDGGRYKGWQRLGGDADTVQGRLEAVLSELAGARTEVVGSGRTDAGVHALGQVASFRMDRSMPPDQVRQYLNRYLPKDIAVTSVEAAPGDFHARFHAREKTYLYRIWNREASNPFHRRYSLHVPKRLAIAEMREAARFFLGRHDFTAFTNARSKSKSMVREVFAVDIAEEGGFLLIRVRGDGFLHNMVRRMVGTLVDVGLGTVDARAVPDILSSKDRGRVDSVADACGLFLESVGFGCATMQEDERPSDRRGGTQEEEVDPMGDKNPNKQPKKKKPASAKPVAPTAAPVYSNPDKKPKK